MRPKILIDIKLEGQLQHHRYPLSPSIVFESIDEQWGNSKDRRSSCVCHSFVIYVIAIIFLFE